MPHEFRIDLDPTVLSIFSTSPRHRQIAFTSVYRKGEIDRRVRLFKGRADKE